MDEGMNITRENDELVVRIPLKQKSYDALGDYVCETANLIGVIASNEFSISHLIDLGYKGDQQEGMPILYFDSREELEKVCKANDIDIWEHPICTRKGCGKVLRGVMGWGENGEECCEHEGRT